MSFVATSASATEGTNLSTIALAVIPDTFAINATNDSTVVQLDHRESLTTQNQPIEGKFGEASKAFGSMSLTKLKKYGASENPHFYLSWSPSFTFAYHQLQFETPSAFLSQTDFRIFRTSLGFGPELNLATYIGTFFAGVSPGMAYSWISYSSPVSGGALAKPNLNLTASIGYHKYVTNDWAVRFFANQVFEDKELWREALNSSQGFEVPVTDVYNVNVGASVCYTFAGY